MSDFESFGLDLILSENQPVSGGGGDAGGDRSDPDTGAGPPSAEGRLPQRTLVYDDSITTSGSFYVHPPETGWQIPGPGTLDTLLLIADASAFTALVETESAVVLNDTHSSLKTNTAEMSHISAYDRSDDGSAILAVNDLPFRSWLAINVQAHQQVTFSRVRALVTVGSEQDY